MERERERERVSRQRVRDLVLNHLKHGYRRCACENESPDCGIGDGERVEEVMMAIAGKVSEETFLLMIYAARPTRAVSVRTTAAAGNKISVTAAGTSLAVLRTGHNGEKKGLRWQQRRRIWV